MTAAREDMAAVIGVGYTDFSRSSGRSTATLALQAITAAIDDAGIDIDEVDGIGSFSVGDSVAPVHIAGMLGLTGVRFLLNQYGGGSLSHTPVAEAARACVAGAAKYVVCYRSLNARSGLRPGSAYSALNDPELEFSRPHGYLAAVQQYAMTARLHMQAHGTTDDAFAAVAIQERENAQRNPRAMMQASLTRDEYYQARWISEPFRLYDCCLETDGACAVVVAAPGVARRSVRQPVYVAGAAVGVGHTRFDRDWLTVGAHRLAPRLFGESGLKPSDVSVACLYDAFTFLVILQLEAYGFCEVGQGGPFVSEGATEFGGPLPVNPHGGMLSEGYIHGFNNICEAVLQLRGEAGERQVRGATIALSTGEPGVISGATSALLLRAG